MNKHLPNVSSMLLAETGQGPLDHCGLGLVLGLAGRTRAAQNTLWSTSHQRQQLLHLHPSASSHSFLLRTTPTSPHKPLGQLDRKHLVLSLHSLPPPPSSYPQAWGLLAVTQKGRAVSQEKGSLGDSRGLAVSSPRTSQRTEPSSAHTYPA